MNLVIIKNFYKKSRLFVRLLSQFLIGSKYDLAFITPPSQSDGWILEAICREIASNLSTKIKYEFIQSDKNIPYASKYFFSHYMYFVHAVNNNKIFNVSDSYIWFTHFESDKHHISDKSVANYLMLASGIICPNAQSKLKLIEHGIQSNKLSVVLGGADENFFMGHQRLEEGCIGFSSAFYTRKNPDLIFEIISLMPDRKFILLGRGWDKYEKFKIMKNFSNLEYVEVSYDRYPEYYSRMSVFVSVSSIEGGPIPVLEAMMSNVVPVISDTGFARDLVEHGVNGYIFPCNTSAKTIVFHINQALQNSCDVRATVLDKTWKAFSTKIESIIFS